MVYNRIPLIGRCHIILIGTFYVGKYIVWRALYISITKTAIVKHDDLHICDASLANLQSVRIRYILLYISFVAMAAMCAFPQRLYMSMFLETRLI